MTVKLEIYIYHHKRPVKKLALLHVGHCGHDWNKHYNHSSHQIALHYLWLHTHQVYTYIYIYLYGINGFLYTDIDISGSGNLDISPTSGTSSLPQDTVCADQFIKINGICYARCDSFEQSPHDVTVAVQNIQLVSACYGFIVGIFVLILSFVRWKTMYVNYDVLFDLTSECFLYRLFFPSIFLVYMTAGYCIVGKVLLCVFISISHCLTFSVFFIILGQIDRSKLYCNYVAITKESLNDPSKYCLVTGWTMIFSMNN